MHLSSDMGRECCVCLVWHRICLIPFSVSVALSESFLWSVNLNVIAWPNHYKSGFVRIFSYKAGAVQGYLLYSFTEEFIEVNLPLSSQNAPRGTGFDLVCPSWEVAVPYCCPGWLLSLLSVFQRHPCVLRGYQTWQVAHLAHLLLLRVTPIAAAPSVTCPFTWVSILLFSKWKSVSVLYLLSRKCQVFPANDMKVLEIYFESEAKKDVLDYFFNVFFR